MHFAIPVIYKGEFDYIKEEEMNNILEKKDFDWWGPWGRFCNLLEYFYLNKKFGFAVTDLWVPVREDLIQGGSLREINKEIKLTKGVREIMEGDWEYIFIIDGEEVFEYTNWKEVEKDYGERFDTEEWKIILMDCHM